MLEVILFSVIGVGVISSCCALAYYKCIRVSDDGQTYILDMRDSDISFTFNEIYSDTNNSVSNSQI